MRSILSLSVLLGFSFAVPAEVVTDGSLGAKLNLPGPDFQVEAKLGQQVGGNLFHSFQDFNLQSHESATFSGPDPVQNIISRVTGGNPSSIDGLIRSTIPNADLYLLNPYGIMFGPNAKLDVQGGFHASTADYLRLQDGGRFEARTPGNSLLTVAPVAAFGFLNAPTDLQIQGSQLTVAPHADFSLMGGNLTLNQAQLTAESGRINLVSVASSGEVTAKLDRSEARVPDTSRFSQLGQLRLTKTLIDTSGSPSGGISIRGGQFWLTDSRIHAHNSGQAPGKGIEIELRDSMTMTSEDPSESPEAFGITSDTLSTGTAGHLAITVPRLDMRLNIIDVGTKGEGNGGDLDIQTQQMSLGETAEISSNAYGAGAGGQIHIKATERLELVDQRVFATVEEIGQNRRTVIQTNSFGSGNGGNITIDAPYLRMSGSYILSNSGAQSQGGTIMINSQFMEQLNGSMTSASVLPQATGNSGGVKLNVSDTLKISGFRPGFIREGALIVQNSQSAILSGTAGNGKGGLLEITAKNLIIGDYASVGSVTGGIGNAGDMLINVDNLYLQNGGMLTDSSGVITGGKLLPATGNGGHLAVTAKEDIIIEGRNPFYPSSISTNTFLSGHGGHIELQANRLIVRDGGTITANSLGTGNAGNIHIKANEIHLSQGGEITSAAMQAVGGSIVVKVPYLLYLRDGQITTSVRSGVGSGGDISIDHPQFVVMNKAQIKAQADEGRGGNIHIVAEQFIPSTTSLVSASSRLGIDGNVEIDAPDETVSDCLLVLPGERMDASALLKRPCSDYVAEEERSHFYIEWTRGKPLSPEGRQGSLILPVPKVRF